uniref:ATP binding cassette subfamily F member 3 n=1 Tax=Sander lucioperca TaxID=283035 RepID=A0A8C9XVV2_SANLU
IMATYVDILKSEFPEIDTEVFDYITGVLASCGADFEDGEEVYEAVGGVLQDVSADSKNEDDVRDICLQMFNTLKLNNHHGAQRQVLLDAPVQLSQISADNGENQSDVGCDHVTSLPVCLQTVDAKKLEKAEAKLRQKHDRRNEKDSLKPANPLSVPHHLSLSLSLWSHYLSVSLLWSQYLSLSLECLLQGAELSLSTGRRYGLIGRNGLGKTTLLKMLASRSLRVPAHITILHVEQEVAGDETAALQSVLSSDTLREELLGEEKTLNARIANGTADGLESVRLTEIYAKLEEIEADKAPAREFSGGWRMRLALARALFARPDLLLLDEPTNMLDVRAILWLETYLQTWQSTILVVSHDRNFLNAVVTDIVHLHSQRLDSYRGDYENFIKTKEDRLKNQQREYEAQLQYRQHIQVFIDRFRYNANRAAQVQSKLKLLERLPELKPLEKETEVTLKFPDNFEKLSPPILQLDEVEFYYSADRRLFSGLSLSADLESRICIVGENGAGKTTVLKLLMGELTPVNGVRQSHRNLKIGYFSQHHVDQLDLNVCSVELLLNRFPGRTEEEYRHQLGGYGITGELATRPVASLSGGQKSRVAFAQMTMPCPNFYILDEPTNHLDMESIEALAKALNKFRGGVILVSHDERLIRLVCKELWVCEAGSVRRIDGGFDEYRDILHEQFRKEGYL